MPCVPVLTAPHQLQFYSGDQKSGVRPLSDSRVSTTAPLPQLLGLRNPDPQASLPSDPSPQAHLPQVVVDIQLPAPMLEEADQAVHGCQIALDHGDVEWPGVGKSQALEGLVTSHRHTLC